MSRPVWLVDAFTDVPFSGNAAGVVPEAEGLSDAQMQAIANELHASETVFVLRPQEPSAEVRFRYFTPSCEVDLCGHATIAAVCRLAQTGRLSPSLDVCRVQTNVGVLPVSYSLNERGPWAEMRQASPQFRPLEVHPAEVMGLLGLTEDHLDKSLPLGISYTGLWDVFIPVRSLDAMQRMMPDFGRLKRWNEQLGVVSTHVYTREVVDSAHHFHARDFSPVVGVAEDPATGTATGALMALLHHHGLVSAGRTYWFEQGYEISRASMLAGRIAVVDEEVHVFVGGTATVAMAGEIPI